MSRDADGAGLDLGRRLTRLGRRIGTGANRDESRRDQRREPPDPTARARPDGLLRRAVRRAQLLAGRPERGARREVRQHPPGPARVQQATRPIVTADGVVVARSLPDTDRTKTSTSCATTRPATCSPNVTGYFTKDFGSTQVERTLRRRAHRVDDRAAGPRARRPARRQRRQPGTVQLTLRHDAQEAAKFVLGGREGSVTVIDPNTGAILAMYTNPTYDPNTFVNADFDVAQQAITDLQNADGNPLLANAYQERYMPGSTFKVITTGIALEAGMLTPRDRRSPTNASGCRRRPTTRSRTTTAACAAATSPTCSAAAATSRSRRPPSSSAPTRWWPAPGLGHRRGTPDRPPTRRDEHVRQHRQPRPGTPAARHPRVRAERGPDGAVAHGDGRRDRRQRRSDDAAVRRRGDLRSGRSGARSDATRGLEDADLARRPPRSRPSS